MESNNLINFLNDFYKDKNNEKNKKITCKKLLSLIKKDKSMADNILDYQDTDFMELLTLFNPTSLVELSNLMYRVSEILKAYCNEYNIKWDNSALVGINKDELWESIRAEKGLKRYFSEKKYRSIIDYLDKDVLFDGNDLYYKTLFMAIYEGMYNKSLTEIKNLRLSDIDLDNNIATLYDDDGNSRKLEISEELKNNLVELSKVNVWYKIQGRSTTPIGRYIGGEYSDSIFKVLTYNNKDLAKSYKEFYYRRLKVLCDEFLGYSTTPMQIFVSGIINRVYAHMKQFDVTVEDLRNDKNNFTSTAKFFIRKECERVNYDVNIHSFMRVLKSYADIFDDNIIE